MDVLLIHGAGTGGWLWDTVAGRLRSDGDRVWAPSLSGVGERIDEGGSRTDLSTHVAEILEVVQAADLTAVTMVGFSYGGLVAGVVASLIPDRVRSLVYVDGFVPVPGRSMLDMLPPEVAEGMRRLADDVGEGWRIPPLPLDRLGGLGRMEDGVDPGRVHATLSRRGPHPIGTYAEPAPMDVSFPADRTRYVSCVDKPDGDPLLRIAAVMRGTGVRVEEIRAGHFAMLTVPGELTSRLVE